MRIRRWGRPRSLAPSPFAADVVVEVGQADAIGEAAAGQGVAVVAQWSPDPAVDRSTAALVNALAAGGYQVVVTSTCEASDRLVWPEPLANGVVVVRRPNRGYDFGSWAAVLGRYPAAALADRVLLVNDSMIGPLRPLEPVLEAFAASTTDVFALTDSDQFAHHLQSYFLGFRGGVLATAPLARFWADVRHHDDKLAIILENELGLSRLLREQGLSVEVAFPYTTVVEAGENPVIIGWRGLLEAGFPFLKREILRDPSVAPDGPAAPEVVRRLTGCDLAAWAREVGA